MRNIICYEFIKNNIDFWLYFIMTNFPESLNEITDMTCMDIIEENYDINEKWINKFTNYSREIFDENDGYVENPNTLKILLANGDILYIEFHPGDTIYYVNENEIGSTGPHYQIKIIELKKYLEYTYMLNNKLKLLLLPMLKLSNNEKYDIRSILNSVIKDDKILNLLNSAIIENLLCD